MSRLKLTRLVWAGLLSLALGIPLFAQGQDPRLNPPATPVPPVAVEKNSKGQAAAGKDVQTAAQTSSPSESQPLAGAETFSIPASSPARSFLDSDFEFSQVGDSNAQVSPGYNDFRTASLVRGRFGLRRVRHRSELSAQYSGGGILYNTNSSLNETFHEFGISQRNIWGRWTLLLDDQASYLPESSFGFPGFAALNDLGGQQAINNLNLGALNPLFTPNQSVLTGRANRVSNAFVSEVDYQIGERSSLSFTGGYSFLRFLDGGFNDSKSSNFQAGYNHALTGKDTIAILYGASFLRFSGIPSAIDTHTTQLAYGRQVTGRLALQLFAGPQVSLFRGPTGNKDTRISEAFGASLRYVVGRSDFSLSYLRGITGGGGVLAGSQTDQVQGGIGRQLTRMWSGSLNGGYARNAAILTTQVLPGNPSFDTWYAGAGLRRALGRTVGIEISYNARRQTSGNSGCTVVNCAGLLWRQFFRMGIEWHPRPIGLQ